MHGSVWKGVLPYCLANSVLTLILWYAQSDYGFDLSIKDKGHVFMSAMVSFLVVAETSNSLNRYMEARTLLSDLMCASRELLQHAISFSRYKRYDKKARDWRIQIAQQTIAILDTVSLVLRTSGEWKNKKSTVPIKIKFLSKEEERSALLYVNGSCERVPFVHLMKLRSIIASHGEALSTPLQAVQELALLKYTANTSKAYHFLQQLSVTRYPFPLVQMTRTFLFIWIFTLPFALVDDVKELIPLITIVFFCTYGLVGLELVSTEIEDPFGEDPNDFCVDVLVQVTIDDIAVFIEDIDGRKSSMKDDVIIEEDYLLELRLSGEDSEDHSDSNDDGLSFCSASSGDES